MSVFRLKKFHYRSFYRIKEKHLLSVAGFTLLEMMVAVAVMAISLTTVYKLHAQTIRLNALARFNAVAPLLAQERIALIDSKPLEDADNDSGNFEDGFENYAFDVTVEDTPSEYLEISSDLGKDSGFIIKKITVEITEGNGQETYRLTTYRMMMDTKR